MGNLLIWATPWPPLNGGVYTEANGRTYRKLHFASSVADVPPLCQNETGPTSVTYGTRGALGTSTRQPTCCATSNSILRPCTTTELQWRHQLPTALRINLILVMKARMANPLTPIKYQISLNSHHISSNHRLLYSFFLLLAFGYYYYHCLCLGLVLYLTYTPQSV